VSQLSLEGIYREISKIVEPFRILECDRCAKAIIKWLEANEIKGKILRLRTRYKDDDFIISDRLERRGITESITLNGQHYGVEIEGRVFDNLSKEGLTKDEWLKDFHCASEEFILEELEDL
jgi:Papain fold toxin 2